MKFNFLGGQRKGFSPNQNTQETVNMFLEVDSSEEDKLTLYRVDGKKDFIELPKSPIYNMVEFRGALYVVAGDSIYKIIETVSGFSYVSLGSFLKDNIKTPYINVEINGDNVWLLTNSLFPDVVS